MRQDLPVGSVLEVARQIMTVAVYAALVTVDEAGHPSSRAVAPFPPDEEFSRIFIGTHSESRKTAHVARDERVVLSYIDAAKQGYVTVIGTARLNDDIDARKTHWIERFAPFWPEGPESDAYRLIELAPRRLEIRSFQLGVADEPTRWSPAVLERARNGLWSRLD